MAPNHNNHHHPSRLPRQVTIHIQVPIPSRSSRLQTSGRSGKAPIPSHNRIPTSIHNHPSTPNYHWCCTDENQVRHPEPKHNHVQGTRSIGRGGLIRHKKSGKSHLPCHHNTGQMLFVEENCPVLIPAPMQSF
jgi:hypothetical protein